MTGKTLYKSSVDRDLKQLSQQDKERVLRQVRAVLGSDPRGWEGLHGEFEGLYKLRVGDYRVVYALVRGNVLVLRIRHRGKAY